jgi:type I restriction enzyme S subunit
MNADRLMAHYETIVDAPDAISRLRRFILDLAVRGKLVPQDQKDEPASELLKRIAKEKAWLMKAGEMRTPKAIPAHSEAPFPIPSNWRWSQLAEIGVLSPRNEAPDTAEASFVPMPLISAEYGVANQHEVRSWGEIKKGYTHFAEGDVGVAKITPCFENGKSAVFRNLTGGMGAGTTELHIIRPLFVDQDYILLFLKSPHFIETGIPKMTGTAGQKRVPTEYFAHSPFPLPPLAEQRRIVAKVDELMGLCDRLEAARAGREAVRDLLAAASLARLNAPDPETFQADAHFALDALPALTTRPDQIKRLRQTILNLAVRGKLVPQDPNDEPVAMRYQRELGGADIPKSWRVLNFGKFCDIEGGNQPPKSQFIDEPRKGYVRLLQIRDLGERPVPVYIPVASARSLCKEGEILIGRYGASVGKVFWAQDGAYNVAMAKFIWPVDALIARFAFLLLKSEYLQGPLAAATRSAQAGFNKGDLAPIDFPLPPLLEQHRIVAKVDALMALCDRLEASLTATAATRRRLLDALLAEALAPVDVAEMEAAE